MEGAEVHLGERAYICHPADDKLAGDESEDEAEEVDDGSWVGPVDGGPEFEEEGDVEGDHGEELAESEALALGGLHEGHGDVADCVGDNREDGSERDHLVELERPQVVGEEGVHGEAVLEGLHQVGGAAEEGCSQEKHLVRDLALSDADASDLGADDVGVVLLPAGEEEGRLGERGLPRSRLGRSSRRCCPPDGRSGGWCTQARLC